MINQKNVFSVGIITRHYLNSSKPQSDCNLIVEIKKIFKEKGIEVKVIKNSYLSNDNSSNILNSTDAILSMSRSYQTLELLKTWELLGIPIINSPESVFNVLNRPYLFSLLNLNDFNVPKTIWTKNKTIFCDGKYIKKQINKSFNGKINKRNNNNRWALYQEYIEPLKEVKIYLIGDRYYFELSKNYITTEESLVLREKSILCQKILGIQFLSIDFILAENSYFIVDVNDFPSYEKVLNGPKLIVDVFLSEINHK